MNFSPQRSGCPSAWPGTERKAQIIKVQRVKRIPQKLSRLKARPKESGPLNVVNLSIQESETQVTHHRSNCDLTERSFLVPT